MADVLTARQRLAQALLDNTTQQPAAVPFTWGSNGARLTADEIANRRKDAAAMVQQGTDTSPLPTGTRGAGIWTQGMARVAKALVGGLEARQADQAEKANADTNKQLLSSLVGGGDATTAAPTPTAAPAALDDETQGYIKAAADKHGVDPAYLTRTAMIESGGNPNATNTKSGASGLFQFMPKTAKEYELANPLDPEDSAMAAAELAKDNRDALTASLGREPTNAELYLAHQQGAGGAAKLLANPNAPAISVVGRDAVLNNGGAENMTAGQFANQWLGKFGPEAPAVAPTAAPAAKPGLSRVVAALSNPYADDTTKKVAGALLTSQLGKEKKDTFSQQTDADGNIWSVNNTTGQRTVALKAENEKARPMTTEEKGSYNLPTDAQYAMTAKGPKYIGSTATTITNNVDMNSGQTYDKQLAEGLAKSHAGLANGVEDAQSRARDVAAMQGAIDAIQRNGGTTGGMAPEQTLRLQKTINAGASVLGIPSPFDENGISDKEMMTKFNRNMAGAQAKNAVGNRVTNFEMSNYLKANPGLDMSVTGNQRMLGIQAQIEQRNIAVGNAIREATAAAISSGKKLDPVMVQKIITDYDAAHHVSDPTTGQDLTQSYALPEFQQSGSNPSLAVGHETNINGIKIKRVQ